MPPATLFVWDNDAYRYLVKSERVLVPFRFFCFVVFTVLYLLEQEGTSLPNKAF